jgi:hypothetical protein
MHRTSWRDAVLLIASARCASAGEVWSWHALDATIVKTSRAEITLHGRLRTGRDFATLQQGRTGVITRFAIPRHISLIGGYYYGKEEDAAEDWRNLHRVFGGLEAPLYRARGMAIDTRALVERFFVPDSPEFTRYRHRFRLNTAGAIGPYLSSEWFFDAKGYLSSRNGAGIRWRFSPAATLEFGYLYDARRSAIGEPRHVVVTQLRIDPLWR